MKVRLRFLFLSIASSTLLWSAEPTNLSKEDTAILIQTATTFQRALKFGDSNRVIRYLHPSVSSLYDSYEQFESRIREGVKSAAAQTTIEKLDWGTPTPLYANGREEVCFLPKTTIEKVVEGRYRRVSYLIAARKKGNDWLFLDGDLLQKDRSLLWRLFRGLPRDIVTPPSKVEPLE